MIFTYAPTITMKEALCAARMSAKMAVKGLKIAGPAVLGLVGGSIATNKLYDKFFLPKQVNILNTAEINQTEEETTAVLEAPTTAKTAPAVTKGAIKSLKIGLGILFAASVAASTYGVYKQAAPVSTAIKNGIAFVDSKLNDGITPIGNRETIMDGMPDFSAFPTITKTPVFVSLKSLFGGLILPAKYAPTIPSHLSLPRIIVGALFKR
jgi:hypothetical protein